MISSSSSPKSCFRRRKLAQLLKFEVLNWPFDAKIIQTDADQVVDLLLEAFEEKVEHAP